MKIEMNITLKLNFSALMIFVFLFLACKPKETQKKMNYSESITELEKLINLSNPPQKVYWEVNPSGLQSNDYTLTVLLCFDSNSFPLSIVDNKNEISNEIYLNDSFLKPWFPENIKKSFQKEGDYLRPKGQAYNNQIFSKSPLTTFFYLVIDNSVLISLNTN